jgi:hypothetical protein
VIQFQNSDTVARLAMRKMLATNFIQAFDLWTPASFLVRAARLQPDHCTCCFSGSC